MEMSTFSAAQGLSRPIASYRSKPHPSWPQCENGEIAQTVRSGFLTVLSVKIFKLSISVNTDPSVQAKYRLFLKWTLLEWPPL